MQQEPETLENLTVNGLKVLPICFVFYAWKEEEIVSCGQLNGRLLASLLKQKDDDDNALVSSK